MARSTLLVGLSALAVAAAGVVWLSPGRVALSAACAAGLVVLSLNRRRALTELTP